MEDREDNVAPLDAPMTDELWAAQFREVLSRLQEKEAARTLTTDDVVELIASLKGRGEGFSASWDDPDTFVLAFGLHLEGAPLGIHVHWIPGLDSQRLANAMRDLIVVPPRPKSSRA